MASKYFYDDCNVFKNKLNIKNKGLLIEKEAKMVHSQIMRLMLSSFELKFNLSGLCEIHKELFGKVYEWAGQIRKEELMVREPLLDHALLKYKPYKDIEKSVEFILDRTKAAPWETFDLYEKVSEVAGCFAQLWSEHPFRKGNLETLSLFIFMFSESKGIQLSLDYLLDHSNYLRDALVDAIGSYDSKKGFRGAYFLNDVILDSIDHRKQIENSVSEIISTDPKSLNDYKNIINDKKNTFENEDNNNKNKESNKSNSDKIR